MRKRRCKPEEIIRKLREAEVLLGHGRHTPRCHWERD